MFGTDKVYIGSRFIGEIKKSRGGFEVRTAQAIAKREDSYVRYGSYEEAFSALEAWAKRNR